MKKKILCVDDEWCITDLMFDILSEDYDVVLENDPENVESYFDSTFSLVITDYSMPRLDGVQLSEKLKCRYNTPILMVTASVAIEIDIRNINGMISKPFNIKHLKDTIKQLLE